MFSLVGLQRQNEQENEPVNNSLSLPSLLSERSFPVAASRTEQLIQSFQDAHSSSFWTERRLGRSGFEDEKLGRGLSDEETLKFSGALDVLKLIKKEASHAGRQSLWVSSNLHLNNEIRDLRRAACREIAGNVELQKFISIVFKKIERLDRNLDNLIDGRPRDVALLAMQAIQKDVLAIKKALSSEPKIESVLLKKIISDIHDCINSGSLLSVQHIEKNKLHNFIQGDSEKLYFPTFSAHTSSTLQWMSVIGGIGSLMAGAWGVIDLQSTEFSRLFALAGWPVFQLPYSHYLSKPWAKKCGKKLQEFFQNDSREKLASVGALLSEFYTLAQLRSRFPDSTSFAEHSSDNTIEIEQMKHPKMCLQGSNPVPSNIFVQASKPVFIGGQNTGGKTICVEGLVQNFIIDALGGPMFGTKVRISSPEQSLLQVPQQSKGTLGGGRFETEALQTIKYASITDQIVLLSLDEVGGGTSREEARPVQCLAIGELAAKGYFVVVVSHDYELIKEVVSRNLASSLMVELDETGAPTFQMIPGLPTSSGFDPVLNMTGLAEEQAIARIRKSGGSEDVYWRFRNEQ